MGSVIPAGRKMRYCHVKLTDKENLEEDWVLCHGVWGGGAVSGRRQVQLLSGAPCLWPSRAWSSDPAPGSQHPFSSKHRGALHLPA